MVTRSSPGRNGSWVGLNINSMRPFPGFVDPSMAGIPARATSTMPWPALGSTLSSSGGRSSSEARRCAGPPPRVSPSSACIPPVRDSEAYYQVALSREETGSAIVPDLPMRLHPGVIALRQALRTGELGAFRALRWEVPVDPPRTDLVRVAFPRAVDVVRALLGEIEALTATGDPPGDDPDIELVVQLRADGIATSRGPYSIWSPRAGPAHAPVGEWIVNPGDRSRAPRDPRD